MKRTMSFAVLIAMIMAAGAQAQDNPKAGPTQPTTGPEQPSSARNPHGQLGIISRRVFIADLAPDFELDGSHGAPVKLSRMRGDWILLIFADRRDQIVATRAIEPDMRQLGVRIVGVCHEKARTLDTYAARDSVPLMLADVTGEVAAIYGLWDSPRRQIVPGFLVLDREGIVRIAFFGRELPPDEIGRLAQFAVGGL